MNLTTFMQNKPNSKTEDRKQNTEDSKIMAKDKPSVFYNCRESSTNQAYFMQNKANLLAVSKMPKMNITSATTVNYINELRTTNYELIMKNKANQTQFQNQIGFGL